MKGLFKSTSTFSGSVRGCICCWVLKLKEDGVGQNFWREGLRGNRFAGVVLFCCDTATEEGSSFISSIFLLFFASIRTAAPNSKTCYHSVKLTNKKMNKLKRTSFGRHGCKSILRQRNPDNDKFYANYRRNCNYNATEKKRNSEEKKPSELSFLKRRNGGKLSPTETMLCNLDGKDVS